VLERAEKGDADGTQDALEVIETVVEALYKS
jgi:hypothetical protein